MSKQLLIDLYEKATDKDLMMSRRDVHAFGLDSYVLRNWNGRLSRVYHTRHNTLASNYPYSPFYSIGLHDHRYDLTLMGVQGVAISYQWASWEVSKPNLNALWHYRWRTQLGGNAGYERTNLRNVELRSSQELFQGRPFYLSYNILHTVWAEPGAAWMVFEGEARQEETNLLTQDGKIDVQGLYHEFADIRDVRESFERAFA
jgi:hypothetical protein